MKTKVRALIIVIVSANLSACTYIKSLFPDKEKDYQFTTEIPPLTIPPDLAGGSITNVPAAPAADAVDAASAAPSPEPAPSVERKLIQVELISAEQGTKRLHIGVPPSTAWRMVGKALSRKFIEVTNRNQEEGLFHVLYDPNKKEVEDGGVWDEVVFFLKGFETNEQEYVLKLVENDVQQTDVIIMDKEQKPIADEASLSLLTLLHDTIKADLAK
ncbi:MAG TPA: outer membrane protein assembly factor BamC [Methylobacter sp.]|jgi:outer membrane protein assembly factor BamC